MLRWWSGCWSKRKIVKKTKKEKNGRCSELNVDQNIIQESWSGRRRVAKREGELWANDYQNERERWSYTSWFTYYDYCRCLKEACEQLWADATAAQFWLVDNLMLIIFWSIAISSICKQSQGKDWRSSITVIIDDVVLLFFEVG